MSFATLAGSGPAWGVWTPTGGAGEFRSSFLDVGLPSARSPLVGAVLPGKLASPTHIRAGMLCLARSLLGLVGRCKALLARSGGAAWLSRGMGAALPGFDLALRAGRAGARLLAGSSGAGPRCCVISCLLYTSPSPRDA